MSKKKSFFRMGYEAFRAKDVNKDGYSLACDVFPDVIVTNHPLNEGKPESEKIPVFDHSLQRVDLYDKFKWARGWQKARTEYIERKNGNIKEVKKRIEQFFKSIGIKIDKTYTNDLYMKFTAGSKATFNVDFLK